MEKEIRFELTGNASSGARESVGTQVVEEPGEKKQSRRGRFF